MTVEASFTVNGVRTTTGFIMFFLIFGCRGSDRMVEASATLEYIKKLQSLRSFLIPPAVLRCGSRITRIIRSNDLSRIRSVTEPAFE